MALGISIVNILYINIQKAHEIMSGSSMIIPIFYNSPTAVGYIIEDF